MGVVARLGNSPRHPWRGRSRYKPTKMLRTEKGLQRVDAAMSRPRRRSKSRDVAAKCTRSSAGQSNGFLIQQRLVACICSGLRTVADARCLSRFGFARVAQTCAVLHSKNSEIAESGCPTTSSLRDNSAVVQTAGRFLTEAARRPMGEPQDKLR